MAIALGKTLKTVGLRGEIKVYPYDLSLFEEGTEVLLGEDIMILEKLRFQKNMPVIKLSGIDSIEEAEEYLDLEIFRDKDDIELEEDEYYLSDLLGLTVVDENARVLGVVKDVLQPSSQWVYVIEGEKEFLLPAVDEYILSIDMETGMMVVRLIEGIL